MPYNEPQLTKDIPMISTYAVKMTLATLHNTTLTEEQKQERFIQKAQELDGYTPTAKQLADLSFGGNGKHSAIANKIRNKFSK